MINHKTAGRIARRSRNTRGCTEKQPGNGGSGVPGGAWIRRRARSIPPSCLGTDRCPPQSTADPSQAVPPFPSTSCSPGNTSPAAGGPTLPPRIPPRRPPSPERDQSRTRDLSPATPYLTIPLRGEGEPPGQLRSSGDQMRMTSFLSLSQRWGRWHHRAVGTKQLLPLSPSIGTVRQSVTPSTARRNSLQKEYDKIPNNANKYIYIWGNIDIILYIYIYEYFTDLNFSNRCKEN